MNKYENLVYGKDYRTAIVMERVDTQRRTWFWIDDTSIQPTGTWKYLYVVRCLKKGFKDESTNKKVG